MDIFQIIASMASIISIPLAIYYARKNNNTTSEKARLDIIKTLSYRLSSAYTLTYEDIDSVYKSKLREHEIVRAQFNQEDILNDLKSDIMSNAFLENDVRNKILYNLSSIEFINSTSALDIFNKPLMPFIRLFISPIPYIFFVASIITSVILLCPYILDLIFYSIKNNSFNAEYLYRLCAKILYYDLYLHISLICLFVFSVISFFRKKYIKKHFHI